jgi:PAS domain S-box-containing protein
MPPGPDSVEEQRRLAEIDAMDLEAARPAFERICRLLQCVSHTPLVHIGLVQADTIWLAGVSDQPMPVLARTHGAADLVMAQDDVLWLEDTSRDERFANNPFVTGPYNFRFYAGAPIRLPNGHCVGALSIIDRKPRPFDAFLAARLRDFAAVVADDCERRRVLRDVVEREAEARAAGAILAAIIESAPVALAMTNAELNIIRASARWRERAANWTDSEMIGLPIHKLVPGTEAVWRTMRDQCMAGQTLKRDRALFQAPDGISRWVNWEVSPWRDSTGAFGGLLVMVNEITEMVNALENSERAERRLELAAELAQINVWELDFGRQDVNYTGASIYPVQENDFTRAADTIWDIMHPVDRPAAEAAWDRHLETGEPFNVVVRLLRPNAPHLWVQIAAEASRRPDGEVDKVVGATRNIDREKRAERSMAKALDAAEAANRAKSEFLANMSHEIRTPLNGVMGIAGALARSDLDGQQRELVQLIESSAGVLDSLLGDVLDVARIESGRLELAQEPFELAPAIGVVAALFEAKAREKGLGFEVRAAPAAEAQVTGDVVRLRQIVSNLLSNAVKFTDAGKITVQVEATRSVDTVNLQLTVRDTGIGFDAKVGAKLFQRFEQADGSITRRFGGTGLGLAISRSLAEAMGGTLEAVSEQGKGSAFTLTLALPRARATGADTAALTSALDAEAAKLARGAKVLLAEDHPTNRKVVSLILESVGVELTVVENGREAVDASAAQDFDVILMDMQMPVMDGLTAVRLIREREQATGASRTPILALTANAMPEHTQASLDAGADGHLSKPIAAAKLVEAVRIAAEHGMPDDGDGYGAAWLGRAAGGADKAS